MFDLENWVTGCAMGLADQPVPEHRGASALMGWLAGKRIRVVRWSAREPRGPGVYKANTRTLLYSWEQLLSDELLEGGVLRVEDGVLNGNPDGFLTLVVNGSAPYLTGDLVIPEDAGITSIGGGALCYCPELTSVIIPEGVTTLEAAAFYNCTNLSHVQLPASAVEYKRGTFYGVFDKCTSLRSIVIPEGVQTFPTFSECTALEEVNIPEGVTELKPFTFCECESLQSVQLPESLEKIQLAAFEEATALQRIRIPAATTIMDGEVFAYCTSLLEFEVAPENPEYTALDGNLYTRDMTWMDYYACGKTDREFVVPEGVQHINSWAFAGCQSIEKVTIASTVTNLWRMALGDCTSLTTVVVKATTPPKIPYTNAVGGGDGSNLSKIIVPRGTADAYKAAECWSEMADLIVEEYTDAPCVVFTGEQYIDTGIVCTQDTTIEAEFVRDTTIAQYLYGASSSDNTASVTAYMSAGTGSGNWRFGGTFTSWSVSTGALHSAAVNSASAQMDGTTKKYSGTVGAFATPVTLVLGTNHTAAGAISSTSFYGKVYSFRVYDGDTLLADYAPAVDQDGVYGFWDRVTKCFRPSDSDTPFGGAPVTQDARLVSKDEYTLQDIDGQYLIPKESE